MRVQPQVVKPMRQLYEKLGATLRGFIDQRDDWLLLVAANDSDSALVLQSLREFDHQSPGDLVMLFGQPFAAPDAFLDTLAGALRDEVETVNAGAAPDDTPLPAPPEALSEPAVPAPARLKFALGYAASLVYPRGGQRYVWGMVPGEIRESEKYVRLLAGLPTAEPAPWMRGGRVIARVPVNFDLAKSPLAGAPRVRVEKFVIPDDAHEKELLATLNDPAIPEADRMGAATQLGFIDAAHDRLPAATAHFNKALAFFQWVRLPAMEGLVMMGLGDVARRRGDRAGAKRWQEAALVPAAKAESPILMASIVQHLGVLAYERGDYAEAAERYHEVAGFHRAMFSEDTLAEALEWEGESLDRSGKTQDAVFRWYEAALIGKTFNLEHRLATVLPRLRQGYEKLGWADATETFDEQWGARGIGL
jgi:tetratricopeptide (TPR) repeat protein